MLNVKASHFFQPLLLSLSFSTLLHSSPGLCKENAIKIVAKPSADQQVPYEDIRRFTTAINRIKNHYVKTVDDKQLFEDAIRGMLEGLDPHSAYLSEEEYKDLKISTRGEFGGLGIEVGMEDDVIKVISPIDDTPAAHAGVKAGDLIIRIDDTPIKGMSLKEAVNRMRGKKGSSIKLTILRKKEKKPLVITIVRDVIHIKSVKSRILEDGFAYIRISHFQDPTANDLAKTAKKLREEAKGKLKGIVLDLRSNPGGLLDSAIEVSDAFLNSTNMKRKMIVYTEGRFPGSRLEAKATPGDLFKGIPLVVLINGGSASASEIVAGAIQDHKRGIIMGTKTFGKGSVQTVLPLDENQGIKLTTALYFTPKGRSIQAEGIEPDIIIQDIKIPKKGKEESSDLLITSVKESNLSGHLESNGRSGNTGKDRTKERKLLREDYQLHQALTLLKGLHVLGSPVKTHNKKKN